MKSIEKTCQNCIHFFISGMLQSWGEGAGYCLLIQNNKSKQILKNVIRQANKDALMGLKDTCNKFESAENLK
ncbi:hypothetical protein ACFPH8_08595 [Bizionia hallyeonensis]|uniref:Uncharacterized protein n=1 Tax=Bizionia hallyeonensis TaxID=1123757 RepID=A0ABW0C636_9FLAO